MAPLTARQYPWVIAAIAATLVGGLVLGPEVALVSTGSFVGTWFAQRRGGLTVARGTMVGVIAAVLALFIGPLVGGTFAVSSGYTFRPADVVGAIGTAVVTALLLAIGRFAALGLVRVRGGDHPQIVVIPAIGALVGGLALAYTLITGNPIALVLTSGEGYVREALALGTTGAIVVVTLVKLLAYTLSMGGGFRGGPYFPAIFVGGGVGGVATLVLPNYAQSGAAAGIAAAVAYLAHAKWGATAVIGLVLAAFTGSWQVAPITLLAALVGRAIPKVELAAPKPEDAPASTSPSSG
jgi:H+/Cl- antiporter ClcA